MPISMPRTLGALTALLALGTPAWSQQKPPSLSSDAEMELFELLNTPVTGASKREQRLIDSPQAIEVLTGDEIRQMGIHRLQDALKLMTGVDILEQDNGFSVVGMRGVMQQGQPRTVQVLIDGVPMYNAFASSIDIGNLPLPIDVIDRIEVVRGPSSTLYGANAVVGVIAITTKKAANGMHGDLRAALADKGTSRWSSAMEWGSGGFGVTAGYQGASLGNTGRTGYNVGDLNHVTPLTMDTTNPDGSHQQAGSARLDWKNDHTSLWLSAGEGYRKYGQFQSVNSRWYDNKTLLAGWHETWSSAFGTEVRLHQVTSNYQFKMQDASATAYAQARALMGLPPVDISSKLTGSYTFADTTTSQIEVQANWDPSKDLHFVMGLDTRKVDMKKVIFLGLNQDETNSASGGFLSMDWTFTPGWTLSLGARAENEGLGGSRTSPRATLVWAPTPTSVFRCGYYTSTRSPQMAETKVDYTFPSANSALGGQAPAYLVASQILPNDLLKPEKSTNYELGYRQSIGAVTVDLTLYQMKISDQITSASMGTRIQTIHVPLPPPYPPLVPEDVPVFMTQFQNKGSATNKGAELTLTWAVQKDWKAGLNGRYLTYTQDDKATALPPGAPAWVADEFSYAPKSTVTAWTRFSRGGFSGYFDVQHIGSAHVEALTASAFTFYNERPAYVQCDIQLGYEVVKGLNLGIYARNAAREYTLQGGTGPDRPFIFQVQRRELGGTLSYRF